MGSFHVSKPAVVSTTSCLMSLPTCLVHSILSHWVEVISVIRLDFACTGDTVSHPLLLDILKSKEFFIKEVKRLEPNLRRMAPPSPAHKSSRMLDWFLARQVKIIEFEMHEQCSVDVTRRYLQSFGEHVRRVYPRVDDHFSLVEQYCSSVTGYSIYSKRMEICKLVRILNNNPNLETLVLDGDFWDFYQPLKENPIPVLLQLKRLEWYTEHFFDENLTFVAEAASNSPCPRLQSKSVHGC